jgi:probable F420-dependent oxidoreductase
MGGGTALKLGLGLPQRGGVNLRTDVVDVARAAETAGFSSLWAYERLLFPMRPRRGPLGVPDLAQPSCYECADPLSVLAVAAVVTDSVRLGASVTAPLPMPVQLANALATIDRLSGGGRLVAGVSAGWPDDELRAVGSTLAERTRKLDETLDVLQAVGGDAPVTYHGQWSHLDRALVRPKPLSEIPVMLDGASAECLDRIARRARGWLLVGYPPETARDIWATVREAVAGYGRDPSTMEMIYRAPVQVTGRPDGPERLLFVGGVPQIVEDIWVCSECDVTELIIELGFQDMSAGASTLIDTALDIRELAASEGLLADRP